jgi:rhodanese-related sulfurtransferase
MPFTNKPQELTPADAATALIEGKLTLVDVRNADERGEAHVAGSRRVEALNVRGGMLAWEKAGLATERARKSA